MTKHTLSGFAGSPSSRPRWAVLGSLLGLGLALSFTPAAEAAPQPSKPAVRHLVEQRAARRAASAPQKAPVTKQSASAAQLSRISKPAVRHLQKRALEKRASQVDSAPVVVATSTRSTRYPATKPAVSWLRERRAR